MTMDHGNIIGNMMARVEQCRRLAAAMTDTRTATILNEMADQIEADIERLQAGDEKAAS